jgi:hypothetical protein
MVCVQSLWELFIGVRDLSEESEAHDEAGSVLIDSVENNIVERALEHSRYGQGPIAPDKCPSPELPCGK